MGRLRVLVLMAALSACERYPKSADADAPSELLAKAQPRDQLLAWFLRDAGERFNLLPEPPAPGGACGNSLFLSDLERWEEVWSWWFINAKPNESRFRDDYEKLGSRARDRRRLLVKLSKGCPY